MAENLRTISSAKLPTLTMHVAARMWQFDVDEISGKVDVGVRLFGFWGTQRSKDGCEPRLGCDVGVHSLTPAMIDEDQQSALPQIPAVKVMGRQQPDFKGEEALEVKLHHLESLGTDAMVTLMEYRTLMDTFTLRKFPFDEHKISIYVRLTKQNARDSDVILKVLDLSELSDGDADYLKRKERIATKDVGFHGVLECVNSVKKNLAQQWAIQSMTLEPHTRGWLAIKVSLKRHPYYYVARMIVPSGLAASLACLTWALEVDDIANRSALCVTLLLTLQASHSSYASHVPKLPYLTMLDAYLSGCLGFTFLVAIANVLAGPTTLSSWEEADLAWMNRLTGLTLAMLWLGFNLAYCWYAAPTFAAKALAGCKSSLLKCSRVRPWPQSDTDL